MLQLVPETQPAVPLSALVICAHVCESQRDVRKQIPNYTVCNIAN